MTISPRAPARARIVGGERVERAAPDLLIELRQFARHRRRTRPKLEHEVGERVGEASGRFVKDERPGTAASALIRSRRADCFAGRNPRRRNGRSAGRRRKGRRAGGRAGAALTGRLRAPLRRRACSRDRKSAEFRRRK